MVQLDTGSRVDILSQEVAVDTGKEIEPYDGRPIALMGEGEFIKPLGTLTLDWHVLWKAKTYRTTFLVLDATLSEDFDALLGRDTIGRVGFYKTSDNIW